MPLPTKKKKKLKEAIEERRKEATRKKLRKGKPSKIPWKKGGYVA